MQIALNAEVARLLADFANAAGAESVDVAAAALITDSISRLVHRHRRLNIWSEVAEIRLIDEIEPGPRFEIYPHGDGDDATWIVTVYDERGQECGGGQFTDYSDAYEFGQQWVESHRQEG